MWESRVLGEISKSVRKPFCGFHGDVISTAVFVSSDVMKPADHASTPMVYFVTSSVRKSVWTLVRQLRGPHLRTCA